jgi:hypothetical protein
MSVRNDARLELLANEVAHTDRYVAWQSLRGLIMGYHGPSWAFMALHGSSWAFMGLHGPSWAFMALHGSSWAFTWATLRHQQTSSH